MRRPGKHWRPRQKLKDEEETIAWCRACGRHHLFGATEIIPSCSMRA
jgi:hypothetical protein